MTTKASNVFKNKGHGRHGSIGYSLYLGEIQDFRSPK